ncbi:MAG: sensor domain-containing diguanylate cyclase [Fibrobacter sp.]|nr:sensor domain-containing diguanylate cyclase [Fibrobacter sp.]
MHSKISSYLNKLCDFTPKETFILSGVVFLVCLITIVAAFLISNVIALIFLALSAAFVLSVITVSIQESFSDLSKKISKGNLITRRFQNISKYFESILQDSTDIIFSIDTDGYILKFSKGSQIHFGYTQEEIVGKPLSCLFENESDHRKVICSVLLSGKSINEEISMRTKDGGIILVDLSMSEMKSDNNQIIGLVVTAKDITEKKKLLLELEKKNELLGKLAITDNLSDLYNSRFFHEQIKRELTRFKRNPSRKLSLILLDIDHFKNLNDTEGHQMGDHVLRSLGRVIKACIRQDIDTGFRYGGDEFVIILPDTDKFQAKVVAERIQKQFGAFKFGKTSLSFGIAEAMPDEDQESLVKRADEAMYTSKRDGRARVSIF